MGYQGQNIKILAKQFKKEIEIVKRQKKWGWFPEEVIDVGQYLEEIGYSVVKGFRILQRRWVVERTFAWVGLLEKQAKVTNI